MILIINNNITDITDFKDLEEIQNGLVKYNNIFVYIKKELYEKLSDESKIIIDETSFDDIQGENPRVTLNEILEKDIVYVKYSNTNEIQTIQEFRKPYNNINYGIISE